MPKICYEHRKENIPSRTRNMTNKQSHELSKSASFAMGILNFAFTKYNKFIILMCVYRLFCISH